MEAFEMGLTTSHVLLLDSPNWVLATHVYCAESLGTTFSSLRIRVFPSKSDFLRTDVWLSLTLAYSVVQCLIQAMEGVKSLVTWHERLTVTPSFTVWLDVM